ncbi:MAG TPA: nucleoside transporter C-terminal domain-containing protein [Gemmataceae bacterium]|nr:nucleoside transporter C-terminal domain-containing protein [Gemmataceae bacterium]
MNSPDRPAPPVVAVQDLRHPPTPLLWRALILAAAGGIGAGAYFARESLDPSTGPRVQAGLGALCFLTLAAAFSTNLRAINWRTIGMGIALQLITAWVVLKNEPVRNAFKVAAGAATTLLDYANYGAKFVFGPLADPPVLEKALGPGNGFIFAFMVLPPIIFISSFFTVLYYFGVLQWVVRIMAKVMMYLLGTSGAETLSVSASVFMGQTEAPLIVKPFVARMTRSELLSLMISGMAHVSGGIMAVYIGYGAEPVAILTTVVMACPCSLYLTKLLMPETGHPETRGDARPPVVEKAYVNAIDAASAGAADGLRLALNVAAMLIAFLAFIALFNGLLAQFDTARLMSLAWWPSTWVLPEHLSLEWMFGQLFSPVAFLMGIDPADTHRIGSLLGTKLVANEHVAYITLTKTAAYADLRNLADPHARRTLMLVTFALTGFANFSSIGIQIGWIGGIAPDRRHDLAKLGTRALFGGFLVTLINAAVAGMMID